MAVRSLARQSTQKDIPVAEAKKRVLLLIGQGAKVAEACEAVGRSVETYRDWQKSDLEFKAALAEIRASAKQAEELGTRPVPDFPEFCRDYLHQPLFEHQLRAYDVICGREPRNMHESMSYEVGQKSRILMNFPPDHAKSTTFTVNYVTWMIHKNPNIRIIIMSQSERKAKEFLGAIKFRLTSPVYREMHLAFAPGGGWKDPDQSWTANAIYVMGKGDGDPNPTVQAMGLTGQIYGSRSDLIILDDIITTKNVREIDKQTILIEREIESRLPPAKDGGGLLLILGTRVAPIDLYRELRGSTNHYDERVFTYFRQPAVLDYGDGTPDTWVALWPERWSGPDLARQKRGDAAWNLIYQQMNVAEDMTFKAEAVEAAENRERFPGPMTTTGLGHRPEGMAGLYVVGGLDPATVGCTAMIIAGLDRNTGKRWVLDGFNKANTSPLEMREQIKKFTDQYHIQEWVIERNAFQRFLTQDPELNLFLQSRGCKLTEHYTTSNKTDPDFGIMTLGPLFDSAGRPREGNRTGHWERTPETSLIDLPSRKQNAWVAELISQLVTWEPSGMAQDQKTDLVMALWFTDIAFKKILGQNRNRATHLANPFLSSARRKDRTVVNLQEFKEAAFAARTAV